MNFLIPLIPYIAALLGIVIRVSVPYLTKQAGEGDIVWDTSKAVPVILGGLVAFAVLAASGSLDAATWQEALGLGLAGITSTIGTAQAFHMASKANEVRKN